MKLPKVIAHRGNSRYFVENTIDSILSAVDDRVEMIEIDLRQTKDGRIIIFHDENLRRLFNQKAVISSLTYDELYDLAGDEVLLITLEQLLKTIGNKTKVIFEIKKTCDEKKVYDLVMSVMKKENVVFGSFDFNKLENLRAIDSEVKLCSIFFIPNPLHIAKMKELNVSYASICDTFLLRKPFVESLHENGIKCLVFTVNTELKFNKYIKCGVDGIITDVPFDLLDYYKSIKINSSLLNNYRLGHIRKHVSHTVTKIIRKHK